MSTGVQNRGISGPTKRTYVFQIFFVKKKIIYTHIPRKGLSSQNFLQMQIYSTKDSPNQKMKSVDFLQKDRCLQ